MSRAEEDVDTVDAMVFSGDALSDKGFRDSFRESIASWLRKCDEWDKMDEEEIDSHE